MAILSSASWTGIEANAVRPGSVITGDRVRTLIRDLSYLYETVTGEAVPGAVSATASGHHHTSSSGGAPIRVPLGHHRLDVYGTLGDSTPSYGRLSYAPAYVAEGISTVYAVVVCSDKEMLQYFRARAYDTSQVAQAEAEGAQELEPGHWLRSGLGRRNILNASFEPDLEREWYWGLMELEVDAGWNVFELAVWTGAERDNGDPVDGFIREVMWLPLEREPVRVLDDVGHSIQSTLHKVPDEYITLDDLAVADDGAFNSVTAQAILKNVNLLFELITGQPTGNAGSVTVTGHDHSEDVLSGPGRGTVLSLPLGSWNYGVLRSSGAQQADTDETGGTFTSLTSVIPKTQAPGLGPPPAIGPGVVARHLFRLPRLPTGTVSGGGSRLQVCAAWYADDKTDVYIRFRVGNRAMTTWSTQVSVSALADPAVLVDTVMVNAPSAGGVRTLEVAIEADNPATPSPVQVLGVGIALVGPA